MVVAGFCVTPTFCDDDVFVALLYDVELPLSDDEDDEEDDDGNDCIGIAVEDVLFSTFLT